MEKFKLRMRKGTEIKRIKDEYIIKKICEYFSISEEAVFSKSRQKDIVQARHYIIYYIYHYGDSCHSPTRIRNLFRERGGLCNHASMIYAVKRIDMDLSYSIDSNRMMLEIDNYVGIVKRDYLTIHYFMDVNKGHVLNLSNDDDSFLWKHESIQKRGNRMYLIGEYKHPEHGWLKSDDKLYDYGGYLCSGLDAKRVYEKKES